MARVQDINMDTLHLFHAKFLFPYEPLCFVWVDKIASSFITKTVRRKFFIMSTEFDKKTIQIEGMITLITKMTLIYSSNLLNGQK